MPSQRAEANTVSIPKRTVNIFTSLGAALIIGISGILFNLVTDNVRLNERLTQLERFGPGTGLRFTKQDGDRLALQILGNSTEIRDIRIWKNNHTEWGRELVGHFRQINKDHEERIDKLEEFRNGD